MAPAPLQLTPWVLPVSLVLALVAGGLLLLAGLWYRFALQLHERSLFPEDAIGVRLLRYGGAAGLSSFAGFLIVFCVYLLAVGTGFTTLTRTVPLLEVAIGLFLLALSTFIVAGVGYSADALRARVEESR